MYTHARRLVHYDHIIILIQYVERNILRDNLQLALRIWHHQSDTIQRFYLIAGFGHHSIDQYISIVGSHLDTVTRAMLHTINQILIQTQHLLPLIYCDGEMLKKFIRLLALREFIIHQLSLIEHSLLQHLLVYIFKFGHPLLN